MEESKTNYCFQTADVVLESVIYISGFYFLNQVEVQIQIDFFCCPVQVKTKSTG